MGRLLNTRIIDSGNYEPLYDAICHGLESGSEPFRKPSSDGIERLGVGIYVHAEFVEIGF